MGHAVYICESCGKPCGADRVEKRVELREARTQRRIKTNKVADLCGLCARLERYEARPLNDASVQGELL